MSMRTLGIALIAVTGLGCQVEHAKHRIHSPRTLTTYRERHGEPRLTADLQFSQGTLRLASAQPGELYRLGLRYNGAEFRPVSTFDSATATMQLRMTSGGKTGEQSGTSISIHWPPDDDDEDDGSAKADGLTFGDIGSFRQSATLAIAPDVDAALKLLLVDVEADLDFDGQRLTRLQISAGVGTTAVQFSKPNPARCEQLAVEGGIGKISLRDLGNSRCEKITLQGGVGEATLDFGGTWTQDVKVDASITVGSLTVRLPRDVGVRLTPKTRIASFDPEGLVRKNDVYLSPNYDTASRHIEIDLTATLGGVTIEWIDE